MNFVHGKLEECTKSELDLFSVPPTQESLEKGLWIDHQPVSSVSDRGTHHVFVSGRYAYRAYVQNVRSQSHIFRRELMAIDHQIPVRSACGVAKQFHKVIGMSRKHLFRQG